MLFRSLFINPGRRCKGLESTEKQLEIYENNIELYLDQYCIDRDLEKNDLYTLDQSRWNAILLYIYKYVFKPTPDNNPNNMYNGKSNIDYSNKELLENVCNIYIDLCYEYSKEISVMGFSKLTGIHIDTLYQWLNGGEVSRGSSELVKRLNREREESLSNKLASNKGNPVGILGILNRHYSWNMGQPRTLEVKQQAPSIPDMAAKYLPDNKDSQ